MPRCPSCQSKIPTRLALKTTDCLLFPDQGPDQCPACHAKLIPTRSSVARGILSFPLLAAASYALIHYARLIGFRAGFVAGIVAGLFIALGGSLATASLLKFRATGMLDKTEPG